jgi:signal transduction histidine kinase
MEPERGLPVSAKGNTREGIEAPSILVVDDLAENRDLLQAHLEAAGYRVLTAEGGTEALAAIAAHRPDLLLLDIMMPGMSGYEVCQRLKASEDTAFIPVIILTALQEFQHRIRGIEVGADEFLTKPVNRVELLTRVRALLRTKSLHDQVLAYSRLLEQRVAERTAALERALTDLQEMDRLKSEFLANLSHELLTPLTPVKGYLPALLQGELGDLTPQQGQALGIIAESVDRLHRLIDDLLTFMQWESGQARLRLEAVAVEMVVNAGMNPVAAAALTKGVEVTRAISADVPKIWADAAALARALQHLLDNALKFTPSGGTVRVTAHRVHRSKSQFVNSSRPIDQLTTGPLDPGGDFVEIAVSDTGVGISPSALPRIFDRFYQADSSSTRRHGGTGLGLAIVKRILDAHGAAIAVDSLPGEGTTVSIHLPAVP